MSQPPFDKDSVAALMDRLSRAVQRVQYAGGLNPAQWEALRYIARANRYSRSPTAVAEYLGATKGTVSQTLKALEHKGCIARQPSRGDRRAVELALTPAGRKALLRDPLVDIGTAVEAGGGQLAGIAGMLGGLLRGLQRSAGLREFGQCGECAQLCRDCATAGAGGPHLCGITGDALRDDEIALLCVNYEASAG